MPEEYELQLERHARRALDLVPPRDYQRLRAAIDGLASDPRPRGSLKLTGMGPLMRIRVGEYRVIYAVFDHERIVKIVEVDRRSTQNYRRLER